MTERIIFGLVVFSFCMGVCCVAGGQQDTPAQDVVRDISGYKWVNVTNEAAYAPRDGAGALVYKDKMWAVKGSVWTSTDGRKWEQVLEKTPFGKCGYSEVVVFQDKIWHLGSGPGVWNTIDGVEWTCVNRTPPYGGRCACACGSSRAAVGESLRPKNSMCRRGPTTSCGMVATTMAIVAVQCGSHSSPVAGPR